jgi:glycosyltransferase involved in cell wall biosynthesis
VFADDWGRHPSSCQHLIRQLLGRYRVYWVNTIGMRRPRLDMATLRRVGEKMHHWFRRRPGEGPTAQEGPHVLSPRMWPWFSRRLDRRINRFLLARQLGRLVRSLPAPPVAVTTIPIVADLVGALPVRRWAYYCVDDFSTWPGLDSGPLRRMEEELVPRVDRLIAVSDTLQQKLAGMGRSAHLLTHGVDRDFWSTTDGAQEVPQLEGLERPLVVFWGVVDQRLDLCFLRRLADEMRRGTIVLAGPEDHPSPDLSGVKRVVRLGALPFACLPYLAGQSGVLIMPYADLPVTRAMQPLKLKEYLATGKPVVVSALPATREWGDCADVADTPEAFAAAVCRRLETGLPEEQRAARRRLASESWEEKARQFESWALGD